MPVKLQLASPTARPPEAGLAARMEPLLQAHFHFIWRLLRRLGVPEAVAEDATQDVFIVAMRRLGDIEPGKERAFLYGVALRVASDARRSTARRQETGAAVLELVPTDRPNPEQLLEQKEARALLDEILAHMSAEVRVVFILFEIEEMTTVEIAACVGVPAGTVASRLSRARKDFHAHARRLQLQRGIS